MLNDINLNDYKNKEGESVIQSILYEMAYYDNMQPMVNAIIRHSTRDGETDITSFIEHYFGAMIDAEDEKLKMKTIWVNAEKADMIKYIDEEVHIDDLTEFVKKYGEHKNERR